MAIKEFEWKPDDSLHMQVSGELLAITQMTIYCVLPSPGALGEVRVRVRLAGLTDTDFELWAARSALRRRLDCTLRKLDLTYSGHVLIESLDREGIVDLFFTGPIKCARV